MAQCTTKRTMDYGFLAEPGGLCGIFEAQRIYRGQLTSLDSFAVDEGATREALLFRPAESVNDIVLHESVKDQLEEARITTLTFMESENSAV